MVFLRFNPGLALIGLSGTGPERATSPGKGKGKGIYFTSITRGMVVQSPEPGVHA